MASVHPLISLVLVNLVTSNALQCYVGGPTINNGSVLVPLQECAMPGSSSCTKTIDVSTNLVTRQCSSTNCSQSSFFVWSGTCYNITAGMSLQTMCCCYGDGCNSAPAITIAVVSTIVVVTLTFWISTPY